MPVWIDWLRIESGLSGVAKVEVEDGAAAFVPILLNHRWMPGEEKHLASSDDRLPDRLN